MTALGATKTSADVTEDSLASFPAWLREIDVALPSAAHLVITGHTHDVHLLPSGRGGIAPAGTTEAVTRVLRRAGFRLILRFHPVSGIEILCDEDACAPAFLDDIDPRLRQSPPLGDPERGIETILGLLHAEGRRRHDPALIIEAPGRLTAGAAVAEPQFTRLMTVAEHDALTSRATRIKGPHRASLHRSVVWVLDEPNDLPSWFVGRDVVRVVSVPEPSLSARAAYAERLVQSVPGIPDDAQGRSQIARRLAGASVGMTLTSLLEVTRVAVDQQVPADRIEDAVRLYRVGVRDNPWQDGDLTRRIIEAPEVLGRRVLGQPHAIRKATDILTRSSLGLTGSHSHSSGPRPQGILFFAGPTGVGKTELAKGLAELVFGHEDALLRFDMSEFSSEHSEARLIGSPPGYVDHAAGGQLTNGVRQRPFSLVLFDEIDKAHPRILDKFLQILEDGRLTDGSGSTVYFSETLLVFTSNLGVYEAAPDGRQVPIIEPGSPYDVVESRVTQSVHHHFTTRLGRPEILNRLGDNIVVFDFIGSNTIDRLVPLMLHNVTRALLDRRGIAVTWEPAVEAAVAAEARSRIDFGGRGVGTAVETLFVNPLSRLLLGRTRDLIVTAVVRAEDGWQVEVRDL